METLNEKGFWWLPDCPEEKIAGVLSFNGGERPVLDLFGCFTGFGLLERRKNRYGEQSAIWGVNYTGTKFTILNCAIKTTSTSMYSVSAFTGQLVIKGEHVKSFSEPIFNRMLLSFPNLRRWYGPRTIETHDDENKVVYTFNRDIENISIAIGLESGSKLSFQPNWLIRTEDLNDKITITQYTDAVLQARQGESLDYFLQQAKILQQLVSMFFYSPQYFSSMLLRPENENLEDCEIFMVVEKSQKVRLQPFLKYDTIKDKLVPFVKKWFESAEDMYPIQNHLIRSLDASKSIGNEDFLVVAQAVDGITAKIYPGIDSFETRLNNILKDLRGIQLLDVNPMNVLGFKAVRNHYSHMTECRDHKNMVYGNDLHALRQQAKLLLVSAILYFYGLSVDEIDKCTVDSEFNSYRFLNHIDPWQRK